MNEMDTIDMNFEEDSGLYFEFCRHRKAAAANCLASSQLSTLMAFTAVRLHLQWMLHWLEIW
jgi:hypothetical protein